MAGEVDIRDALQQFVADLHIQSFELCTVVSVDATHNTCVAQPINGNSEIQNVALRADAPLDGFTGFGILPIPSVGSIIIVGFRDEATAFVAMYSNLDSLSMLGNIFGGLTKTKELKTQLDKMNTQLQAVISTLGTWIPAPGDGGAALKTAFATAISGKFPGEFTDIENIKVLHGNG